MKPVYQTPYIGGAGETVVCRVAICRLDVFVDEESGLSGNFSIPLKCSLLMLKLDDSLQ